MICGVLEVQNRQLNYIKIVRLKKRYQFLKVERRKNTVKLLAGISCL